MENSENEINNADSAVNTYNPQNESALLFTKALNSYYEGNTVESSGYFRKLLEIDPDNRVAAQSLIMLFYENGQYSEAQETYKSFLQPFENENPAVTETWPFWGDPSLPVFLSGMESEYLNLTSGEAEALERIIEQENISESPAGEPRLRKKLADIHFFRGLAFSATGNTDGAKQEWKAAIQVSGYYPSAALELGILYFDTGRYAEAEKMLAKALAEDSAQTRGRLYLAKSIIAQKRHLEGYEALKRAFAVRPWDSETAACLEEFEKSNPETVEASKLVEDKIRKISESKTATALTDNPEAMPSVRVGLAEGLDEIYLKTGGFFKITDISGKPLMTGGKDTVLRVVFINNRTVVYVDNGARKTEIPGIFELSNSDRTSTTLIFNVNHSSGYQSAGKEDRAYRGTIRLVPVYGKGIRIVNILPIEEYLYSVVPSEMPSSWPTAALEAQAVAARSYTLANMGRFGSRGFDVSGSIDSAFYRGLNGENSRTTAAVDATRGQVLKNNGKYLNAFYSANSAGRTESAESVWGMNSAVTGVTDPQLDFGPGPLSPSTLSEWILSEPLTYSSVPEFHYRSSYRWQLLVPRQEIEARAGKDIGTLLGISTAERSESGRVSAVVLAGSKATETIKGDSIRSRLGGLRSSLFIVMPKLQRNRIPDYFIFAGAGWGHGVGMCQTGAAGMALLGNSSGEILKHYYPLAELVKEY